MATADDIKEQAHGLGFALAGVVSARDVEAIEFPTGRGLKKPSEIWADAPSILILGIVVSDEAMNTSIAIPGGYYPGLAAEQYFNFYYELTESRAWRLARFIADEFNIRALPTHRIPLKPSASLAGLGHIGRSTLLITPAWGPRVRLVGLMLGTELPPDEPFDRDLCAEQPLCREKSICLASCPYGAIRPGDSKGVEPGKKVKLERCVVWHVSDREITPPWDRHIRQETERGFIECARCNVSCPYGEGIEQKDMPGVVGAI
jgi:epoxyqueuosine reductase